MEYYGEGWQEILHHNGLDSFDTLWDLDVEWFEEPNQRRGGWSGVGRIQLKSPAGEQIGIFLKRQQNHMCKSPRHPIRGILTFAREFKNIRRFQQLNVPALEPVYFSQRQIDGNHQAILLTRELEGFSPMDTPQLLPGKGGPFASIKARRRLFTKLAAMLRRLHADKLQHSCLYFKHIFVKPIGNDDFEVNLIDLEKARWQPLKGRATFRDLYTLSRHAHGWPLTDYMRFFLIYQQEQHLSPESKRLWREIADKHKIKTERKLKRASKASNQ